MGCYELGLWAVARILDHLMLSENDPASQSASRPVSARSNVIEKLSQPASQPANLG